MNKKSEALAKIAREIERCKICQEGKSGRPVPGEGSPYADIVFMGEAPGKEEAKSGRPFIGRSGKFLRSLIKEIGLDERDVYITSPVKYLPDRGTPSKADIAHGRTHTLEQLAVIDPKLIVLLGSIACQAVLGEAVPIMKAHGTIIERDGRQYFISLHPAAPLRVPPLRTALLEDFQKLSRLIKKAGLVAERSGESGAARP